MNDWLPIDATSSQATKLVYSLSSYYMQIFHPDFCYFHIHPDWVHTYLRPILPFRPSFTIFIVCRILTLEMFTSFVTVFQLYATLKSLVYWACLEVLGVLIYSETSRQAIHRVFLFINYFNLTLLL
jgi:hypothetical protein